MQTKLGVIVNNQNFLKKFLHPKGLRNGKIAYKLAKLQRHIERYLKDFDATKNQLITSYGKKNENGQLEVSFNITIPTDCTPEEKEMLEKELKNRDEFINEINKILVEDIEFNYDPIDYDDIADCIYPAQFIDKDGEAHDIDESLSSDDIILAMEIGLLIKDEDFFEKENEDDLKKDDNEETPESKEV